MSQDPQQKSERTELPIERGFPIERVNEIASKEARAKRYYRPLYTMHKWWARRLGCTFRAISLYTLLSDSNSISVSNPGQTNQTLGNSTDTLSIQQILDSVTSQDPESLWELYPKDVTVSDKRILDPFMGGGTSLIEASRFDADVVGNDVNPVAWFITKKELDAGSTDAEKIETAYQKIKNAVAEDLTQYYRTPCPNCEGDHEADVMYYQWVKELDCVSCGSTVPLFNDYRVASGRYENDDNYNVLCPDCESVILVEDWQQECTCSECKSKFTPKEGTVNRSNYSCQNCGQKYKITDAIEEQNGFDLRLFAVEYYCSICDENGEEKSKVKSYKSAADRDKELYQQAVEQFKNSDLGEYLPDESIPKGAATSSDFGSRYDGHDLSSHGYYNWTDLFNDRQLYCLATILKEIDQIHDQNIKEFLLLALSDSLRYNSMMVGYHPGRNHIHDLFKTNSFDSPSKPTEANVWGTEYGLGSFSTMVEMVKDAVDYAESPTERYIDDGETHETAPFETSVGRNAKTICGDVRDLEFEEQFDAVITDPPYYDNIIYSELSDVFYVWQQKILADEYEVFEPEATPRAKSIVANPAENKGAEEFETELTEAFSKIHNFLKEDGVLVFTYHHSDSESWGELLEAICNVNFEVTATYPITADIQKFTEGELVSFDIIVVARPAETRVPISWNELRRNIYRTARRTRRNLEQNRELSRGDIGVMEMGECFREYSKHHGQVQRGGATMSAKEVVQEIYGIIQEASNIGVEDVFIDLLDSKNPSFDDVNKLCRGTNATPEELKEIRLYNQDDGFELGTWDNEQRQAYIQERVNDDGGGHLSNLDKLQFLRYRYEKGQAVQNYVEKWEVDDDLRELAGRLADVTGDETYKRVLGDRDITSY